MSPLKFKRLSDESLGSRLASGEAAAFDELYRRYVDRLAAYGSHLLGDADSGDDVAQAALFKAYAALRDGRVPDKMKPWLFRIAHNAAIDLVARRRELPSDNIPERPAVEREPFAGALVEALATLPERQRRVYVLREVHGLRIDETAAELELSAAQVEQALFSARNRLAEQLVFGDRLNCVTVQRLVAGPLDLPERRALKTHLRSCDTCRRTLGVRGKALSLFPTSLVPSTAGLEWLRGLGAGLLGGGAPAAVKVGAVFATATIAAGVPVAVEKVSHHQRSKAPLRLIVATAGNAGAAGAVARSGTPPSTAVEAVALTPAPRRASGSAHDRAEHGGASSGSDGRSGDGSTDQRGNDGSSGDGSSNDGSSNDGSSNDGSSKDGGGDSGRVVTGSGSGEPRDVAEPADGPAQKPAEHASASGKHGTSGPTSGARHGGETTTPSSGSSDSPDSGDSGGGLGDHHSDDTTTTETTSTTAALPTTTVSLPALPPVPPAG